eukprot:gene38605-47677_t
MFEGDNFTEHYIVNIDVGGNKLTGRLPDYLFLAGPALRTASFAKNCFDAKLSEAICEATELNVLSTDGASVGCGHTVGVVSGTIPSCLLTMPNLLTLHLSGNGYTGVIPSVERVSDSLVDLSLSHNELRGTVPEVLQRRVWSNLDLAYNKLTGGLISDFNFQARIVRMITHPTHVAINCTHTAQTMYVVLCNVVVVLILNAVYVFVELSYSNVVSAFAQIGL